MILVNIICEGQTEEKFVNDVLSPSLVTKSICLNPKLIGQRGHKGGNFTYERLLKDTQLLLNNPNAYCTTIFDFYGLPSNFPGKKEAQTMTNSEDKAECIVKSLTTALEKRIDANLLRRFIPYIQMYEFEGLLFSDCSALALAINQPHLLSEFKKIREGFSSPEDINDSPITAPSKRISKIYRRYDKPFHGSLAAKEIKIDTIRKECKLFDRWLQQLEALAT